MPLSATIEEIKTYMEKVEKYKIASDGLPPCPHCKSESTLFKIHSYRERRFLVIVDTFIKSIHCALVRFMCPQCRKTFTNYPYFALPHKHYTRQTIESFSRSYVKKDQKTDQKTYKTVVITSDGEPTYPDSHQRLSPSTVFRWISTLARLIASCKFPYEKSHHNDCGSDIPKRKYRTPERGRILSICRCFFV